MRTVFEAADALPTGLILAALIGLAESPWGDLKGKPISDRALSTGLRQYGIGQRMSASGNGHPRDMPGRTSMMPGGATSPLCRRGRRDNRDGRDRPWKCRFFAGKCSGCSGWRVPM